MINERSRTRHPEAGGRQNRPVANSANSIQREGSMSPTATNLREQARAIWDAAVSAARPETLIHDAFNDPRLPILDAVSWAPRILVVGGGKAGAAMSAAVEAALAEYLDRIEGLVNVPAEAALPADSGAPRTKKIRLHAARPAG